MENYRFMELVEKEKGFEFYQAFRDEVDWIIGGKDDTFWFTVMKNQSVKETYVGKLKDGVWTDRLTLAIVAIIVAIDAAPVPRLMVSARLMRVRDFLGTTISQPG